MISLTFTHPLADVDLHSGEFFIQRSHSKRPVPFDVAVEQTVKLESKRSSEQTLLPSEYPPSKPSLCKTLSLKGAGMEGGVHFLRWAYAPNITVRYRAYSIGLATIRMRKIMILTS